MEMCSIDMALRFTQVSLIGMTVSHSVSQSKLNTGK